MAPMLEVSTHDPGDDEVRALLTRHLAFANEMSPSEHVHALDVERLRHPDITFVGARLDGRLVGVGALRSLGPTHGELKSMHTAAEVRGRGVGRAIVEHLLAMARARGNERVSLETGSGPAFEPAWQLYRSFGFAACEPFGDYTTNEFSRCMTLELD